MRIYHHPRFLPSVQLLAKKGGPFKKAAIEIQALLFRVFLFTDHALGVSLDLSAKLRVLVDGRGLRKGKQRLKWGRLGPAADSYEKDPQARKLWGPEVGRQFAELVARL